MPAGTFLPPGLTTSDVKISTGGTNNQVLTAVDSETIQGEANLTFDGSTLTVTGDAVVTDDLTLNTDSAVFNMGAGNDFTITHDGTTGATIAGNPITITSAGAATWSTAAGILTIDGDDGIVLNTGGSGNVIVSEAMSVGATTAPDGTLHVHAGSAGSVTANSLADDLVVENSATGGISILVPDNANALLNFGSASDNYGAQIYWDYDGSKLVVGTANAGDKIIFQTADGTESAHLSGGATPTFQFQGATTLSTSTGALTIDGTGGVVINPDGDSVDFRVESNGQDHAFFVDGSADSVGMGTDSPTAARLSVEYAKDEDYDDYKSNMGAAASTAHGFNIKNTSTGGSAVERYALMNFLSTYESGAAAQSIIGNVATGTKDGNFIVGVRDNAAGTVTERTRVDYNGNLLIGGTAQHGTTVGTKAISLFNGTAPAGTLTNGASFFCASGEMKVIDAAGNTTTLSPHDDDGQWVFHSKDTVTGEVLHIHMEKLMRRLNDEFGGGFIEEFIER